MTDDLKKLEEEAKELERQREALFKKIQEQKELEKKKAQEKQKETEREKSYILISNRDVFRLIYKTLGLLDKKIMQHSYRVAYIFAKMLQYTKRYTNRQIAEYAVIALLIDLGEFKMQHNTKRKNQGVNDAWAHSIYSYLYLRNFSPLGEMSNVVLYHHVAFEKFDSIMTPDRAEAAMLAMADRLERMIGEYDSNDSIMMLFNQITDKSKGSIAMAEAMEVALNAMKEYNVTTKLVNGDFEKELFDFFEDMDLTYSEKRKYLELLMYAFDFQTDEAFLDNIRTIQIAEQIGEIMLVSEYERRVLSYGALLYDIGKFAMPMDILRKPGRLTDAEMMIIRAHTAYTEYLLEGFLDQTVINVAARHHERLDGSGYPRGMVGKDLTLCERILAVADVVSALSADRVYRKAFPKAKILEILNRDVEEGKLCPHTVNALTKKYDIIMNGASANVQRASKAFVVETAIAFNQLYKRLQDF